MEMLSHERLSELNAMCRGFRSELVEMLYRAGSGHPGGSLSVCEILASLYFVKARVDPSHPSDPGRDRIILSKGHAAPMQYIQLAAKGFFPKEELATFRRLGTRLQGHPSMARTPGVDLTSGPLGMGLSAGVGMALGLQMKKSAATVTVYVVLGDGELNEGAVWEGAMSAAKFKADNLVAIVDRNHVQLDGASDDIMPLMDVGGKFAAFGFEVFHCDGHDIAGICGAIDKAQEAAGKPSVIVADTVKGKGVSFMEGRSEWHGRPLSSDEYASAMAELAERAELAEQQPSFTH